MLNPFSALSRISRTSLGVAQGGPTPSNGAVLYYIFRIDFCSAYLSSRARPSPGGGIDF